MCPTLSDSDFFSFVFVAANQMVIMFFDLFLTCYSEGIDQISFMDLDKWNIAHARFRSITKPNTWYDLEPPDLSSRLCRVIIPRLYSRSHWFTLVHARSHSFTEFTDENCFSTLFRQLRAKKNLNSLIVWRERVWWSFLRGRLDLVSSNPLKMLFWEVRQSL